MPSWRRRTPPRRSRICCGTSAEQSLEIGLVIDDKDGSGHAACPSRVSIQRAAGPKSIGFCQQADRTFSMLAPLFRIANRR